jgi:hypothetical protein
LFAAVARALIRTATNQANMEEQRVGLANKHDPAEMETLESIGVCTPQASCVGFQVRELFCLFSFSSLYPTTTFLRFYRNTCGS